MFLRSKSAVELTTMIDQNVLKQLPESRKSEYVGYVSGSQHLSTVNRRYLSGYGIDVWKSSKIDIYPDPDKSRKKTSISFTD